MGAVVTGTLVLLQERGDKDEKTDKEPWFHGQAVFLQFCGGTYSYGGNPGHHGTGRIPGAYGGIPQWAYTELGIHTGFIIWKAKTENSRKYPAGKEGGKPEKMEESEDGL